MEKRSYLNEIMIVATAIFFAISIINCIIGETAQLPMHVASAIFFLCICAEFTLEKLKPKHYNVYQAIGEFTIIISSIVALCLLENHVVQNTVILCIDIVIITMLFTLRIVRLAVLRVQNKVEFQPMRPIIKP